MGHGEGKYIFLGFCVCICILYAIGPANNQKRRPHAMYVLRRVLYNPQATLEGMSSSHKTVPQEQLWKARDSPILKAPGVKTRSAFQTGSNQLTIFLSGARGGILAVNGPNDSVAGTSSSSSNDQGLDSSPKCRTLRADRNPVLDVAKHQEDGSGDADGNKQGMGDVLHAKVRDHGNKATWVC
jgi:hypothetical protein